jgi:hypothetical protein
MYVQERNWWDHQEIQKKANGNSESAIPNLSSIRC